MIFGWFPRLRRKQQQLCVGPTERMVEDCSVFWVSALEGRVGPDARRQMTAWLQSRSAQGKSVKRWNVTSEKLCSLFILLYDPWYKCNYTFASSVLLIKIPLWELLFILNYKWLITTVKVFPIPQGFPFHPKHCAKENTALRAGLEASDWGRIFFPYMRS